jgi:hypothetical protein
VFTPGQSADGRNNANQVSPTPHWFVKHLAFSFSFYQMILKEIPEILFHL